MSDVFVRDPQERATALIWSLKALRRLTMETSEMSAVNEHAEKAFVAASQAVWWLSALDQQARDFERPGYKTRRNNDDDGRTVAGLTWMRDRLAHQVPVGIGPDKTSFFPGPPFHITPNGFVWMDRSRVPPPDDPKWDRRIPRTCYDAHVGQQSVARTLGIAVRWFEREQSVTGSLLAFATGYSPGLPESHHVNRRT